MDPITGVGLVASVATLGSLAMKSLKNSLTVIRKIRDTPKDIQRLIREVSVFNQLLHTMKATVQRRGLHSEVIRYQGRGFEVSGIMELDLRAFSEVVDRLAQDLGQTSLSKLWLRTCIRRTLSEERVEAFENSFKMHIANLSLIHAQIMRYALQIAQP